MQKQKVVNALTEGAHRKHYLRHKWHSATIKLTQT